MALGARGRQAVQVLIDDEQILGSPFMLDLLAAGPDLERTLITGNGLSKVRAGEAAVCNVKLLDSFENAIGLSDAIRFGLALVGVDQKLDRKKRPTDQYMGKGMISRRTTGCPTCRRRRVNCNCCWYEMPVDGKRWKRTQLPGSPSR